MSAPVPARLVITGFDAEPGERFDRLRDLVAAATRLGWEPDVLLVAGGEELDGLRHTVPVTVADEFRRRGIGFVPTALGWSAPGRWLKRQGLRRWTRARAGLPWIVADPAAAGMVRYADGRQGTLVAALATSTDGLGAVAPANRAVVDAAVAWIVASDEQAEEVRAAGLAGAIVVGSLAVPDASVVTEATWPLLLVPTAGAWNEVNHTIEIADALARRHPSVPLHWMVRSKEDEWLARYDLERFGLLDQVPTIWASAAPVARYRMLVRTGYGPAERDRCAEARRARIPVVGFEPEDTAGEGVVPAPFDVEALLAEIDRVLPDEGSIRVRQERYEEAEAAHEAASQALASVLDRLRSTA